MAVRAGQIDTAARCARAHDASTPPRDRKGMPSSMAKTFTVPMGKMPSDDRRCANAVHHLVDGAVAARGDDGLVALLDRALRLRLGVAGANRGP